MASEPGLHWLDYVIFSLLVVVSCGIGVYSACTSKTHSQADYLMGSRQMKWLPVALSLMVSYYSPVSQLGKPAEVYLYGMQHSLRLIGTSISLVIVLFTFVPLLFNLNLTSSYEYLELRFESKGVRRMGSLTIIITQILYVGVGTYSPAIALEAVTGFPVWASIVSIGVVASFYTMLGGIKAVVWADSIQSFIMLGGTFFILICGFKEIGGFGEMWTLSKENGRLNIFNFDLNPQVRLSFWSTTIGSVFSWLPFYAVNQASVQRYCSVPTLKQAKWTLLLNLASLFVWDIPVYITGLVIYSYFSGCDPLHHPDPEERLASPNQLLPLFVMKVVNWPGFPGIFLASIFSASFSTVSSCLNAVAAVTWEDCFKSKLNHLSDRTKTNIIKLMVLVYGILGVAVAFLVSLLQGSVIQISNSFLDTSSSPLMGIFLLGAFFKRTNWLGVIIGSCLGFALPMWISTGSYLAVPGTPPLNTSVAECVWNQTDAFNYTFIGSVAAEPVEGIHKLYTISFMWYPTIGTLTTVILGFLASVITAPYIESVHPDDIKDIYLIYPLDDWVYKKTERGKKQEVLDEAELDELTAKS